MKAKPGSKEAIKTGCTCPVADNDQGMGLPSMQGGTLYWIREDCPVHGLNEVDEEEES